jgi:hypothetical protein
VPGSSTTASGNDDGKKKKKTIMDHSANNPNNLPYFIVNKDRFEINKVSRLPKPAVNIYTSQPLYSKLSNVQKLIRDPVG